jgi:hypothetical protein
MKPIPLTTCKDACEDLFDHAFRDYRRTPITDYSYQSATFGGSSGRYLRKHAQSFWNIAGDYLKDEARRDFWSEAAFFVFITITAALPLMNNLHALIEFVRAVTSH